MVEADVVTGDTAAEPGSGTHSMLDVSAHRSSPDRVVFVETGNSDGWVAFDADAAASVER